MARLMTIAEAKTLAGMADISDATAGVYLLAAEDMAERYCKRHFLLDVYTETFATGGQALCLAAFPVDSITSVTAGADDYDDYDLDATRGILRRANGATWPRGTTVAYRGGYALNEMPETIKLACAAIVAALAAIPDSGGQQVQSERLGEYSISYVATGGAGLAHLCPAAAALLAAYKSRGW